MTKYVALLRGINVGGKNIIKMTDLKACFEANAFANVSTYIQSGNILFESNEKDVKKLENRIEGFLSKKFKYNPKVLVRTLAQMKKVLHQVPNDWKKKRDIRCYIAFIKGPLTAQKAVKEVDVRESVDFIKTGSSVLYMTSLLSGLTKSSFSKLAGKKIYQDMTIRNFNTTQKITVLMETL